MSVEGLLGEILEELRRSRSPAPGLPMLLTLEHAARELSLSTRTVARMVARGELVVVRVRGSVRVAAAEVARVAASAPAPVSAAVSTPRPQRAPARRSRPQPATEAAKIRAALRGL